MQRLYAMSLSSFFHAYLNPFRSRPASRHSAYICADGRDTTVLFPLPKSYLNWALDYDSTGQYCSRVEDMLQALRIDSAVFVLFQDPLYCGPSCVNSDEIEMPSQLPEDSITCTSMSSADTLLITILAFHSFVQLLKIHNVRSTELKHLQTSLTSPTQPNPSQQPSTPSLPHSSNHQA